MLINLILSCKDTITCFLLNETDQTFIVRKYDFILRQPIGNEITYNKSRLMAWEIIR